MQNAKLSLTLSIKTCRKLYGSVPIVQGKVRQRTHRRHLDFTLETPNGSGDLSFLDLNINEDRKISSQWYQKATKTGIILNFRNCAPLQHKKNAIQGTVHRIFNATSDWQSFDVALKKNQEIWTQNQYPTENKNRLTIDQSQVNILKQLDVNKSMGHDNIGDLKLKSCHVTVSESLTLIFQTCLNKRAFPDTWKTCQVAPILKEGNKADVSCNRPMFTLLLLFESDRKSYL